MQNFPKHKTALLLLNGEPPPLALIQTLWPKASFHLFADGAQPPKPSPPNELKPNVWQPNVILGDLDSLKPNAVDQPTKVVIQKAVDQQKTDAEKCLEYLHQQGYTHVHVLGADGLRLDHSLYNLKLLCQFTVKFKQLMFWNAFEQIFAIQSSVSLEGFVGQRISFFPGFETVKKVSTGGLAYNLWQQDLDYQGLCSISNQFAETTAWFELEEQGQLIVFLEHQLCPSREQ